MKKLTLVLALLVSFGLVGAFAQTVAPVVEFSAEAEAVFGIDLNEEVSTGFTNSAEADISVTWIDETVANEGEGTYGWIEIEDIAIGLAADEGTDTEVTEEDMSGIITAEIGDINARVYFSPAYLQISTAPGFDYDNAAALRIQAADDNDPVDSLGTDDLVATNGGIILGMDGLAGMIDLAFKVGSVNTYDKRDIVAGVTGAWSVRLASDLVAEITGTGTKPAEGYVLTAADVAGGSTNFGGAFIGATAGDYVVESVYTTAAATAVAANTENEYVFGLDATITPMEMLSIGLGVYASNVTDAGIAFTLNPVFTMGMLEAGLPVDGYYGKMGVFTDNELVFELAPYVTYDLNEAGSNVGLWGFFQGSTVDTTDNATLDMKVSFDEVADGFVPGLETGLAFFAFDILDADNASNDIALGLTFNASYAVGDVKPFVDVKWASKEGTLLDDTLDAAMLMDDDSTFDSDTDVLTLEAGVDLTMVSNTTFTIKYASDNLADDTLDYSSNGTTGIDKGRITFAATVAY